MPNKIILIRHGETQDNADKRFQGWQDTPLNKQGHSQAQALAKGFNQVYSEKIDAIYSSDLTRCIETITPLARTLNLPITQDQRLREHSLGVFEGWNWENFKAHEEELWSSFLQARQALDLDWKEHQGESLREFIDRVASFFTYLSSTHPDETILISTHGGTINRALEVIKHKEINGEYIPIENTSITVLIKSRTGHTVDYLNRTDHL